MAHHEQLHVSSSWYLRRQLLNMLNVLYDTGIGQAKTVQPGGAI